jgi:ligand-binding sensor domain-containing protein
LIRTCLLQNRQPAGAYRFLNIVILTPMRITRLSLLLFVLFSFAGKVSGQSRFNFFTIGKEQGLSNGNVWSINQDKYGYIWIATEGGLNRYDGHTIKQYLHDSDDPHSIAGNIIYWIFKDSDGEMWFACGTSGLSRYNYATDHFETLPAYDSARQKQKYGAPVWRFGEDAQKRIYLSCGGACYRYNKKSGQFEDLTNLFGPNWGAGIGKFFMADDNTMWMPTDAGLYRFDVNRHAMRKIPFDVERQGFGSPAMHEIERLDTNVLMISTPKAGYVLFNMRTEKFAPAADPFYPGTTGKFSEVGDLLMDSKQRLWMAHTTGGLVRFYPERQYPEFMKSDPLYPYPHPGQEGAGKAIFEDRDGNIWYGTSTQGVVYFQPNQDFLQLYKKDFTKAHALSGELITGFCEGNNGNTWITTWGNGVCQFNPATNAYINYQLTIAAGDPLPGIYARMLTRSGNQLVFLSDKGLTVYNEPTASFLASAGKEVVLPNGRVRGLYAIAPGKLLVVSHRAGIFDVRTGQYTYADSTGKDPLFSLTDIHVSAWDSAAGRCWFMTTAAALYVYDLKGHTLSKQPFQSLTRNGKTVAVNVLNVDSRGRLWIGTAVGLQVYDPVTQQTTQKLVNNPLNVINVLDQGGWIWFTTQKDIGRLHAVTGSVELYNASALQSSGIFRDRTMMKDRNGKIWIGGDAGFCIMNPALFKKNESIHPPALTGFEVFDKNLWFDTAYSRVDKIRLKYSDNFFSFTFSAFNFGIGKDAQYAYKLEPFDKEWNYTHNNTASYTNVPPGTYTMQIKCADYYGGWIGMPQKLTVEVRPPFWNTGWFYSLIAVLLVLLAVWLWNLRQQYMAKKRREAKMAANAKENEYKLMEIQKLLAESQLMALRAQMNPHFVFNCLNSIQECIVTQKYAEATTYLNKFSKLFRIVLNNSGQNLVSIDAEKQVLQLYLELEYMRFENKFSFSIDIDEEMEADEILIPSMLLQPYVENALWHGLMHKQGSRDLHIAFERVNEEVFRCTIDDNGIGRARSFELKQSQSKTRHHQSKGLSICKDRIDVLKRQGFHATLEIIDKITPDGQPAGTRVVIELSTYLKK